MMTDDGLVDPVPISLQLSATEVERAFKSTGLELADYEQVRWHVPLLVGKGTWWKTYCDLPFLCRLVGNPSW